MRDGKQEAIKRKQTRTFMKQDASEIILSGPDFKDKLN